MSAKIGIESRPGPDGRNFSHSVMAHVAGPPADHFTDSVLDLERSSDYPMVTAWETDDGWGIEVTVYNERPLPDTDDIATLEGTLAEVIASVRTHPRCDMLP